MEKAKIFKRIDLKKTILDIPIGHQAWIPIEGFTVNTFRSTVSRLNLDGVNGKISVSEDYENRRLIVSRA